VRLPEFASVWENRHLTYGEIKAVFTVVDINKDNLIDIDEWSNFKKLFSDEYETCDTDGDFVLKIDELEKCL